MTEPRRDLGENDVRFTGVIGDIGEKVADSVSHTLHPLVERYAQMFAHGCANTGFEASQHRPRFRGSVFPVT